MIKLFLSHLVFIVDQDVCDASGPTGIQAFKLGVFDGNQVYL